MLIPQHIDDSEILLRFVFQDNFKRKNISTDKIIEGDIFLDTRLVGISLQRIQYSDFGFCKGKAKSINNKIFVGFVLFKKEDYLLVCDEFKKVRPQFESILEFTPLDKNGDYLIHRSNINKTDEGNPSHSDIIYINPAFTPEEARPNIPLRIFSRELYKKCELIIDHNRDNNIVNFNSIESYFQ
ncbi:hypothetical protein [Capnocytophaga canimorsus]|uniref:hypothetical protein n=1 Tax=Capnocytophaga canimorsus TaxID=28188 RepID=UPI000D6EA7AF|nr:hypothetical protein [Capnocytophaga canimorsus]AWL78198.1 hypothetical protein DKB58_04185 [Capnocytophaga canimorsus]AYW36831.1 hypothetical protein D8L92_05635 [Capnocytophaga canimorsus]MDT9499525.1 hypothetical protein [Capnocytophaga canimorsus]